MGMLAGVLAELKAGVGGVVLVMGEQGVGKSSLLRAGLGGAEDQGCRLLWGVADELGQRIPLWLMGEVLGAVSGGDGASGGDGVAAAVERMLAGMDRLCADSPVVLVAEDLQWAERRACWCGTGWRGRWGSCRCCWRGRAARGREPMRRGCGGRWPSGVASSSSWVR